MKGWDLLRDAILKCNSFSITGETNIQERVENSIKNFQNYSLTGYDNKFLFIILYVWLL